MIERVLAHLKIVSIPVSRWGLTDENWSAIDNSEEESEESKSNQLEHGEKLGGEKEKNGVSETLKGGKRLERKKKKREREGKREEDE